MAEGEPGQFGQRLRRLREAAGLTQEDLADRAGLSVKAVSALERGRRQRPYPNTVKALADALRLNDSQRAELAGSLPGRKADSGPAGTAASSLPTSPTPLIGRERELEELSEPLRSGTVRLITLTGPGGVGKTRLALELAAQWSTRHDGLVVFVSMSSIDDPSMVLRLMAQALGLIETGSTRLRESVTARLRDGDWLVVLDNVEHVIDAASELADVLAECPELKMLVTSRAPLKIRAEHEYPVRPLALPDLSHVPTLEEVALVSSVRLFVERAQAAVPAFELTQSNCAAVAAICRRLDGLPLALELAAARTRALSPTDLLARLDQVLRLLTGGSRDLPERQQTMWAAINWSYQLLSSTRQTLFARLSIFAGGWTLDAAEAVTAFGAIAVEDVVELLSDLVEQSLVVVEAHHTGATRYRMLEPVRQFATSCIEESGEATNLADNHLAWCLALVRRAAPELRGPEQQLWLDQLELEHDNLRAALAWSQHAAPRVAELQLATALWRFWETRGYLTEGRRWLEDALAHSDGVPDDLQAQGLNAASNLARDQGDHARAVELQSASLGLRRRLEDDYGLAQSLNNLGNLMLDRGGYAQATTLYEEALSHFRDLGKDWDIANTLNNLGIVLGHQGEYERAIALLEEAIALRDRLGEAASRARSLDALGVILNRQGHLTRARKLHDESLSIRRELDDRRGVAIALNNLGVVARNQGNLAEAEHLIQESLRLRQEVGDRFGIAVSLGALAEIARDQGDTGRALELYREALALQRRLGVNEGLADCLLGLAAILSAGHDPQRAARILGASEALREATNEPIPPVNLSGYQRIVASIRDRLPPDEHASNLIAGRTMTLDEAIDEALEVTAAED